MADQRALDQLPHGAFSGADPMKGKVFPRFDDGDVAIVLTGLRTYQLHSTVLCGQSDFFRALLDTEHAAPLTARVARSGTTMRYKVRLFSCPTSPIGYKLSRRKISKEGHEIVYGQFDARVEQADRDLERVEGARVAAPVLLALDFVLGAFYNNSFTLATTLDDSLIQLITSASVIFDVAEYLQCMQLIRRPIEASFVATGQNLMRAISSNPCAWLDHAYRMRSELIFREAMIHATGQFQTPLVQDKLAHGSMPEAVARMLKIKGEAIQKAVVDALRHINSYYPVSMQRSRVIGLVNRDNMGRASYSKDIMGWIALTAYRHWIVDHVMGSKIENTQDMGFEIFSRIAQGGFAYLDKADMQEFHRPFPMSRKAQAVLECRLAHIKESVKKFVEPLMQHRSRLDVHTYPRSYFTFLKVDHMICPWDERYAIDDASSDGDITESFSDVDETGQDNGIDDVQMATADNMEGVHGAESDREDSEGVPIPGAGDDIASGSKVWNETLHGVPLSTYDDHIDGVSMSVDEEDSDGAAMSIDEEDDVPGPEDYEATRIG